MATDKLVKSYVGLILPLLSLQLWPNHNLPRTSGWWRD